ncbi:MAG TPA: DUF4157 domain-containing protein [Candidatus Limnocylindrales bacterium]
MSSLEGEFLLAPKATPLPTTESPTDLGAVHADGAARALAAGSPESLGPASVLHLQRAAGNASVAQLLGEEQDERSPVKDLIGRGGGRPLDESTRTGMESAFGADFSDVRVHSDGGAAESARAVSAHAYTVGNEIVFGAGRYDPGSPTGQRTLAHELTHVVQQRSGPVDGTPAAGGIRISHPSDRFEQAAERTADRVMSGSSAGPADGSPPRAIQREEEEQEEVQSLAIQREGEEEEKPEEAPA